MAWLCPCVFPEPGRGRPTGVSTQEDDEPTPIAGGQPPSSGSPEKQLEGFLAKKGGVKWKERWFELQGGQLRYYAEKGNPFPKSVYRLASDTSVGTLGADGLRFQVVFPGTGAIKLEAKTPEDCTMWMEGIEAAIRKLGHIVKVRIASKMFRNKLETFELPARYAISKRVSIGEGAYGMVVAASDTKTNTPVAIKKNINAFEYIEDAKRILREIRLMRALKHPNILSAHDLLQPISLEDFQDVYIVTELQTMDLHKVISRAKLDMRRIEYLVHQCLCGLNYMHSAGVLHRDLKPSNILVDDELGLKICDFGLSREEAEGQAKTREVVTLWYRAPELLLGHSNYNNRVDMWSMGLIIAEMFTKEPLLRGGSDAKQLMLTLRLVGTPEDDDLSFLEDKNTQDYVKALPQCREMAFDQVVPEASVTAHNLMQGLLTFDPRKRISAQEAIAHPFCETCRKPHLESTASQRVETADIESVSMDRRTIQRKMFEEICAFHSDQEQAISGSSDKSSAVALHDAAEV